MVATGGDTRLGGEDFDLAIVEHCIKHIAKVHGQKLRDDARSVHALTCVPFIHRESYRSQDFLAAQPFCLTY